MKLYQLLKCVRELRQVLAHHKWKSNLQAGTVVTLLLFAFLKTHGLSSYNKIILCFYILKLSGVFGLPTRRVRLTGVTKYIIYWYSVCKYVFFVVVTDFVSLNSCWITYGRNLLRKLLTHLLLDMLEPSIIQKNLNDFSEKPLRIIILIKQHTKSYFNFTAEQKCSAFFHKKK